MARLGWFKIAFCANTECQTTKCLNYECSKIWISLLFGFRMFDIWGFTVVWMSDTYCMYTKLYFQIHH